jgi:hypothetical protein
MHLTRALAAAALAVGGMCVLASCGIVERIVSDDSSNAPTASPPTGPATPPAPDGPDPVLAWECGQISALSGIAIRTNFEYQSGMIDEVAYVSRLAALQDGWVYLPTYNTAVTPFIVEIQRQAAADPTAANQGYIDAVNAATQACESAGSLAVITPLPEMGG